MNSLAEAVRGAAHSPLGPSSADRWMNCPGSVRLTMRDPEEISMFAVEGNGAHDVLERCLLQNIDPYSLVGYKVHVTEQKQIFDIPVTEEMADAIDVTIRDVNDKLNAEPGLLLVEQRVVFDRWVVHGFGTLDVAILRDGVCDLGDFKYGKGVEVSAIDNTQMKIYALGILQKYGHLYDIEGFRLKIYQPRIDNFSEWYIATPELLQWADLVLVPAAKRALSEDMTLKPGPWCSKNFCKRRDSCRTRAEWLLNQAMETTVESTDLVARFEDLTEVAQPIIKNPQELTLDQLAMVGPMLDSLASWVKDVRKRIMSELGRGNEVGGMKMVEGRSNRAWSVTDELAVQQMLKAGIAEEDIYVKKVLSPAQAEKKARGKSNKLLLAEVIEKPLGKPKLVDASDPRPAMCDTLDVFDELDDDDDE